MRKRFTAMTGGQCVMACGLWASWGHGVMAGGHGVMAGCLWLLAIGCGHVPLALALALETYLLVAFFSRVCVGVCVCVYAAGGSTF